jgi:hypothetical protein
MRESKEQLEEKIKRTNDMLEDMRKSREKLEEMVATQNMEIEMKLTKTRISMQVEDNIMSAIKASVYKVMTDGYNNPIGMFVNEIISEKKEEIQKILRDAFTQSLDNEELSKEIKSELSKKIARQLINNVEGSIEKAINECRQDPTYKAKVILKINEILDGSKK